MEKELKNLQHVGKFGIAVWNVFLFICLQEWTNGYLPTRNERMVSAYKYERVILLMNKTAQNCKGYQSAQYIAQRTKWLVDWFGLPKDKVVSAMANRFTEAILLLHLRQDLADCTSAINALGSWGERAQARTQKVVL